jgi:hypothetical protein
VSINTTSAPATPVTVTPAAGFVQGAIAGNDMTGSFAFAGAGPKVFMVGGFENSAHAIVSADFDGTSLTVESLQVGPGAPRFYCALLYADNVPASGTLTVTFAGAPSANQREMFGYAASGGTFQPVVTDTPTTGDIDLDANMPVGSAAIAVLSTNPVFPLDMVFEGLTADANTNNSNRIIAASASNIQDPGTPRQMGVTFTENSAEQMGLLLPIYPA